ncbi:MAG TPA: HlyD family efflux transporter periplasmic adaptor subunit [Chloroflexota bacterium]|nr:HlyD family efflux transporter periplasmic adaptor subunit [Chloroflexota bacterium]
MPRRSAAGTGKRRTERRLYVLPLFLLSLFSFLLAACAQAQPGAPTTHLTLKVTPIPRATAVVRQGPISETISIIGRVAAVHQADLAFKTDGQVSKVDVKPGQAVKAGQTIAELDAGDLPVQIDQAKLNLELAQLKLDQTSAQDGDTATKQALDQKSAELDVKQAQATLAKAQQDLAKAKAEPDPVVAAQAEVKQAQLALDLAKQDHVVTDKSVTVSKDVRDKQDVENWYEVNYGSVLDRYKKGQASKQDLDNAWGNLLTAKEDLATAQAQAQISELQADQSVQQAQAALDKANADLVTAQGAPKDSDVKTAELALEAAQLGVQKARAEYTNTQAGPSQDAIDLKLLQNSVDQAKVALDGLDAKLAADKLAAPFNGKILYVRVKVADQVQANQQVIGIADPTTLQVQTDLADADLQQVAIGQKATLVIDTLPGQTLDGTVEAVPGGLTGQAPASGDNAVQIKVSWPPGTQSRVELGMLARGTILVLQKPDALIVPAAAIKTVGDRKFVEYMDGSIRRAQNVEVGIVSGDNAEVLSGLKAGQVILVGP